MYIPAPFAEIRPDVLHALMREHPFATLVTTDAAGLPSATHLPLLLDPGRGPHGTLIGHIARPNPQAAALAAGRVALAMFHGPHAYVSPTWYATAPAVPTWNYAAVHAYGVPRVVEDPAGVRALLETTVKAFEAPGSNWSIDGLPPQYLESMTAGVVAFEMPVDRLEGKFKLNQNRSTADRAGVSAALANGDAQAKATVKLMVPS
ncbi:MAG: regulatory protein [Phycisphaerales bacterium]|nr:regulatory protein [Phycisphaerales bacterium]